MSKEVRDRSGVNVLICIHEPSSQNSWEATKYSKCVSPVISKGRIHLWRSMRLLTWKEYGSVSLMYSSSSRCRRQIWTRGQESILYREVNNRKRTVYRLLRRRSTALFSDYCCNVSKRREGGSSSSCLYRARKCSKNYILLSVFIFCLCTENERGTRTHWIISRRNPIDNRAVRYTNFLINGLRIFVHL